jgi:tetratricopeptide (TPR) repeat protein
MRAAAWLALAGWAAIAVAPVSAALAQDLDEARRLHQEGRLDEALLAYRAVVDGPGEPADVANAANNACALLTGVGRYQEAVALCRRALEIRRRQGDARRLGRTLNNLGLALQQAGAGEEAEAAFREALEINREGDDAEGQAANLTNLGMLTAARGRYEESFTYQDQALALAAEQPDASWSAAYRATNLINRGVVLEKLGSFLEALRLYSELESAGGLEADRQAAVWVNMATLYRNLGDPVRTLEMLDRAATVYEEQGNQAALSNVYLNRGLTLWHNYEEPVMAEAALRQALDRARESGDRTEEIQDLYTLGSLLIELGRLDEAERLLSTCLSLAEAAESVEGRWSALEGLGRLARERGDDGAALDRLREAMGLIEQVREDLDTTQRGEFFASRRSAFEVAVEILAERAGNGERTAAVEALGIAHRAKARDLLDALDGAGAGRVPLPSLEDLRAALGSDLLIEYFVTTDRVVRWIVTGDRIELEQLGGSAGILARVGRVHELLEAGKQVSDEDLGELANGLLAGLAGREAPHWWIAPDRRLHYLPFELLPAPGAPSGAPLVDLVEVSYLPSGAVLGAGRDAAARPELGLIGLGDPEQREGARALAVEALGRRFELGALPAARDELAAAARELPGEAKVLLGADATEAALRDLRPGEASVVHLAAHTLLDESSARGPALLLTAGEGEDGMVFPAELAARRFGGRLAVLAGCQTALGGEGDGQALSSLTGALLAAGAEGVVATLWKVDDRATAAFMEQFYYYLGRGETPASALRHAKLRLRSSPAWSRSDLWSAYVLAGGGGPLFETRADRALRWAVVGLSGALLLFVLSRVGRRRGRARSAREASGPRRRP